MLFHLSVLGVLNLLVIGSSAYALILHPLKRAPSRVVVQNSQKPWDDGIDYEKVWDENSEESSLPTSDWDERKPVPQNLDFEPIDFLTPEDAAQLKQEAKELLEKKVKEGVEDINKFRKTMKEDIERERRAMDRRSERIAKEESDKLLGRIDALTDKFLKDTRPSRESTKLAAAADRSMAGKGLDYGAWGEVDGFVVTMDGSMSGLLGSVEAAKQAVVQSQSDSTVASGAKQSRVLIIADTSSDSTAKLLLPIFTKMLQDTVGSIEVDILAPTQQMPLGGNDAAAVVLFLSSISTPPRKLLERLLRRTMAPDGSLGSPPTQLVAVSKVGTERTDKFPYSMQNLMGRKLDNMRLMEESLMNIVKERATEPPLDYTIVKFGEMKESKEDFALEAGDVLDGTTPANTAAEVLLQALAFQPSARNATLCATGGLPTGQIGIGEWDDYFLKLIGPELLRISNVAPVGVFGQFCEYLVEWAMLLPESGKLVTPCRYEASSITEPTSGVVDQFGVKLVFLPTNTGRNYLSKDEEREMESKGMKRAPVPSLRVKPEGGIEVLLEITTNQSMRIRARRCNMGPDTMVKELSEKTILARLEKAVGVFVKDFT